MKIALFRGHNTIYNSGASGIINEEVMINSLAKELVPLLTSAGHIVIDCTPTSKDNHLIKSHRDSLMLRCNRANSAKVDMVLSLHFNAFDGTAHGTEILYISEKGKALAKPVLDKIVSLGFRNRGLKIRSDLYVLKNTTAPAILVEGCFCDSQKDIDLFDPKKMAKAISDGIPASESTPILTDPTATKSQMFKWSEPKFLDSTFSALLDIYWDKAIPLGINPAVPYAQMCIETGYLYKIESSAGIDASYHNPCGLKTSEGGSDTDSSAHKRFNNWEEGIQAHIDHLALYLGIAGYPKANTPDPRHFPYLKGKVTSVQDLGKTWTISDNYPLMITSLMKEMSYITITDPPTPLPQCDYNKIVEDLNGINVLLSSMSISKSNLLSILEDLEITFSKLRTELENISSTRDDITQIVEENIDYYSNK